MKIAHVVRYYPQEPCTNGLEVAITQLNKNLNALGQESEIFVVNDPKLFENLENFDRVVLHSRRNTALKLVNWCKKNKKPIYLVCQNGIGSLYSCSPNLIKKILVFFTESYYIYKKITGAIVFNSEDHRYLHSWFPKLKKINIPWAVDQEKFCFKDPLLFYKKLNLNGDEFLILCPSRIHSGKNLQLPLKIWDEIAEQCPKAHLIFMGHCGPKDLTYKKELEQKIKNLTHKDRVHWVSDISYNDEMLIYAYSAASMIIFPSLKESFGLVLLEASSIGKPIVTSAVGIAPVLIKDGLNGFICEQKDYDSWKKALITLLEDTDLRKNMGNNAKKEIINRYSWEENAKKILEFITER